MAPSELLERLVRVLEELGLRYLVTGSTATIFYGEPRFTADIDLPTFTLLSDFGSSPQCLEGARGWMDPQGRDILGLYAQDTWRVSHLTSLNAGVRYDNYSDFGRAISTRQKRRTRLA